MNTFGQAVRELRRSKGVSQRDLAAKVGVDFSYISKLENDRMPPPSADTIVRICEALDESPDVLLASIGKMPSQLRETVSRSPAAQRFIRQAHEMGITDKEWGELTDHLRQLRRG